MVEKTETKEKAKIWLKNPQNLVLVLILLSAFLVRVYYLSQTSGQTLWWDEAEYMATSKKWAFNVPYNDNEQRPPLFQLLGAFLLKIGLGESSLKFLLVVLPSTFLVFLIFLLGKELFSSKIGLIASMASALVWTFLFWSSRFQPDFLSLSFQLLAVINFWKLFKYNKRKNAIYAGIFTALGFYFKISALLIPLSVLIFALFKDRLLILRNKNYWTSILSFLIFMAPFMIWQYFSFGNPLAFAPSYIGGTGIGQGWDFGWMTLDYYFIFPKTIFFILFLSGLLYSLFQIILRIDLILKDKNERNNPHIFSVIVLIVITLFYIFYIRGTIEDRWVFLIIPFIFYFSAEGITILQNKLKLHDKKLILISIIVIFAFFAYSQIQHADSLIKLKKDSYSQVKDSSLWIKENSDKTDRILSNSYTQATLYSEREIIPYPYWKKSEDSPTGYIPTEKWELDELILDKKPRYIVVSVFEKHPDWINEWINENTARLKPVQAYFADAEKRQPVLIVYEIIYQHA